MKKLAIAAVVGLLAAATMPVSAASPVTGTFDVNITLTTGCKITTAPTAVSFSYTALQTGSQPATGTSFEVTCTKNLAYTLALDGGGSYTDAATELAYSLSLSSASGNGSGAAQSYNVTGTMAGGQAGTCATSGASCTNSTSTNKQRTLTVSY